MSTLYELTDTWQRLLDEIEAGNIPEEAIEDTIEAVEGELDAKIDACWKMVKTMIAEAAELREHADDIDARAEAKERRAERISESIIRAMNKTGRKKFESLDAAFSLRKSVTCDMVDAEAFRAWARANGGRFIEKVTTEKVQKAEIKEALKNGEAVDGFVLTEHEHIQDFKARKKEA